MSLEKLALAAALAALPAAAHHLATETGAYLAFWSGQAAPPAVDFASGNCSDAGFWDKGFVSIYAQGGAGVELR